MSELRQETIRISVWPEEEGIIFNTEGRAQVKRKGVGFLKDEEKAIVTLPSEQGREKVKMKLRRKSRIRSRRVS